MQRAQTAADAAAMAAAATRELIRISVARTGVRRRGLAVPSTAASITPEELSRGLAAAFPGVNVESVRVLDDHSGTTDRARISIGYAHAGGGQPPPTTLFVKTAPPGAAGRLFVNLMELAATEVRFYVEIAPGLRIPVPRAWHAEIEPATGDFVLLLEDLAAAGARFTDVSDRADLETARRAISTLGRMHARLWSSPRLERDLSWLRAPGPRPGLRLERFLCRTLVGRGVERFREAIPEQIRSSTGRIVAARDRLEAAWAEGPHTLLHGDCHIGNMYFTGETVGLLDWQVTQRGQGMRDVSYFVVNSVPTEIRREHERELIELWRSVLDDAGVRPPDSDTAWRQHRLHAIYTWIGAAVTAAAPRLQPAAIARAGLSRATRALADLDSLAALEEIGA